MHPTKLSLQPQLETRQFAQVIGRDTHTIHSHHCRTEQAFGIKPIKVGRMLLQPSDKVEALIYGDTKQPTV